MKKKFILTPLLITLILPLTSCNSSCKHEYLYTDNGDGTHLGVCKKDCSHKINEPHNYSEGNVIIAPTETTPGKVEYQCKNCSYSYTEVLPPTKEHVYDQEIVDDKYLYKDLSSKSKIYFKSSKDGAYGNINYLFERSEFISDARLKDYTEIEYIESGKESYIDTGIKVSNKTSIKTKAYAGDGGHAIFGGTVDDISQAAMYLTFGDLNGDGYNEGIVYYKNANDPSPYSIDLAYKTHEFYFNRNKFYVDNKLYHEFVEQEFEDYSNLFLFGCNSGTGVAHDIGTGIRIYNCEIYEDDTKVRDFIPVYRNNDHKLGMFDFVNYEFYPMISNEKEETYYRNEYRQDELLEGYKQVLYIENDAKNRIDTGLTITINSTDNASYSGIVQINDNKTTGWFGGNVWLQYPTSYVSNTTEPHYIEAINKNTVMRNYCDDKKIDTRLYLKYAQQHQNVKIGVFALGDENDSWWNDDNFASMRIYSLKIIINNELKRDYIPCIREIDNVPGLFDVIENKFYEAENVGETAPLKYEENWEDISVLGKGRSAPTKGDVNCHYVDGGKIVKEPTIGEKGTLLYTCHICHKTFDEEIESTAYKVNFTHPENINISILKDYDPSTGEITDLGYSRNKNSFNYSKIDSTIIFMINSSTSIEKENIEIDGEYKSLNKLGNNFYQIDGIISDLKVNIINKI